jgi:uncharacterized membrane protein YdjX (TVP38/TMEM64 family)
MLQGAAVAVLIATAVGVLGYAGLGGPAAASATGVFLLVGAALVAVFVATARLRRWPRTRKASRPTATHR